MLHLMAESSSRGHAAAAYFSAYFSAYIDREPIVVRERAYTSTHRTIIELGGESSDDVLVSRPCK
eukprot:1435591-Pyramimonas_sp.AAC.1